LVEDISARNIWKDDNITIFNIQLTYPFCKGKINSDLMKLLKTREEIKKKKYIKCCKEYKLNFTSCIASTNLVLGDKFKGIIKNIAQRLE